MEQDSDRQSSEDHSNESNNAFQLTEAQKTRVFTHFKELVKAGAIKNTQFKIRDDSPDRS